ncbi:MAG: type I polyketide synthase, partial [Desulfuromonas sp.]|nr:type I polyketide synthase [Desulfuromonas sp.]
MQSSNSQRPAVSIVGIGGIFPQANTLEQFWSIVEQGICTSSLPPQGRWRLPVEEAYNPDEGKADCVYSKRGCFIDPFELQLPFERLNIDKSLVQQLDPLFQLLLQAGVQAHDDGQLDNIDPQRMGVIVGNLALPSETASQLAQDYLGRTFSEKIDTAESAPATPPSTSPLNRYMTGLPAAVLAKALGLGGQCYTLDAACASSLYAIKLAVDELQAGRADAMLTGGVARPDAQYTQMGFSQLHALSPTGICAPFDQSGNGLVVGEGAGVLLLKRTEDALRDGDHIYAQIAGIGLSNDIGGSLLAPMSDGQLRAMRAAYRQAGWAPEEIDHIECHATGTPVGDAVEFSSLKQLWQDNTPQQRCVIGSVKSNIGHLLTAAGSAAVLKTLLALKHRQLPPTAGFEQAGNQLGMEQSPFSVLTQPQPWPKVAGRPRRAAVSAFGFGGINAHLLLEEWTDDNSTIQSSGSGGDDQMAVAIVGIDTRLGPWANKETFRKQVLGNNSPQPFATPGHWYGAQNSRWFNAEFGSDTTFSGHSFNGHYIDRVTITPGQFRIPPTELQEMLPRQALMLQSAAAALADAGLTKSDHLHSGVFIGTGLDLNATSFSLRWSLPHQVQHWAVQTNSDMDQQQLESWCDQLRDSICPPLTANRTMGALGSVVASRIAREFKFGGQSFTLASEENSGIQALQVALRALRRGELERAVVGSVDMPGDVRAQICREKLGLNDAVAEGACSLVLMPLVAAEAADHTIYAILDDVSSGCDSSDDLLSPTPAILERTAQQLADIAEVDYLDIAAPNTVSAAVEAAVAPHCAADCRISHSSRQLGHSGEAVGLIAVAKATLALHHRILPAGEHQSAHQPAQYWLHNRNQGPRRALITTTATGGLCSHTLLREGPDNGSTSASLPVHLPGGAGATALFALHGDNAEHLLQQLQQLERQLKQQPSTALTPLTEMAADWHRQLPAKVAGQLTLSLVTDQPAELQQQILFSRQHLSDKADQRLDGSGGALLPPCARDKIFYAPQPLAADGELAFVFSGSGNHFPGMGRQLSHYWPAIFEQQHRDNLRLKDQYQSHLFWQDVDRELIDNDHNGMIIAHVALCTALSDTVRSFGIEPQAAIGYSLGESSSLFSLGAWQQRDLMLERIEASTLFTEDLAGLCNSARQFWQLKDDETVDWTLGIVPLAASEVEQAINKQSQAYLLITNTPQECVIGGNRPAVDAVIAELDCPFIELHGVTTVHCPIPTVVAKAYRDLHLFPTTAPQGIRFYSCASGQVYSLDTDACADAILAQAVDSIDFTQVINNAYADGVRLFIETGSGNSCSRMIPRILGDRPHMVRPVCIENQSAENTLARLLGQLLAEGVDCDPQRLFEPAAAQQQAVHPAAVVLRNGQSDLIIPQPPQPQQDSYDVAPAAQQQPAEPMSAPALTEATTKPTLNDPLMQTMQQTQQHHGAAHQQFLQLSDEIRLLMERNIQLQQQLMSHLPADAQPTAAPAASTSQVTQTPAPTIAPPVTPIQPATPAIPMAPAIPVTPAEEVAYDRSMCMEFATGSLATMLGPRFAAIDQHPTRVRLPDEPLMLVDRIISVEGEPCSMSHGRVITEHDVTADRWYLDGGRIPTCVAVEAGQADLFLSGYLGIDYETKGHAVYRLLDAVVQFHSALPRPGDIIRYDIRIERFFRQGDTWLFRFHFESTVNGQPLMTMRNGCAGFFSKGELDAGKGIIHTKFDLMPKPGKRPADWQDLVPMVEESYTSEQIQALRCGDLVSCFGPGFSAIAVKNPYTLPSGHMELVDRVTAVLPGAGRFGMGQIRAEMTINPDDWFLTCHFCDDNVMPGTLMYECCLHTLRIYLMRMGWISEQDEAAWEPVPGVDSHLKCRGQVNEHTRTVTYEVTIKELGYRPEPFAIVDALMYADGKPIVEIIDMSVQISGLTRAKLLSRWQGASASTNQQPASVIKPAIYDYASILAYSSGNPSEAFGEPYRIFDSGRRLARLPRPPFQFLDRITDLQSEAWKMEAGGTIEAQYDVPTDAWYFVAERHAQMPFSVLLEIALQPCGWMAAYVGSALTSEIDLCFRNLDG